MGDKGSAPPPPDYSAIANASKESAELSYKLGREQLDWAKEQYAQDRGVADKVVTSALDDAAFNRANAERDRARYDTLYQPLEDKAVADAASYASPERKEIERGRATATVGQQFDAARKAAVQNLESFGVDPSSTRYGALDLGVRVQQAATAASAANAADVATDTTARALRSEAINVGRGYPGQVAGQFSTALQAGSQAGGQQLATTASGASTMGTPMQWQGLGNSALNTWGNTLNMSYSNQLAQYKANQDSSSGWGSALGLVGGIATKALFSMEEGGAVPEGGAIPAEASPTGGAVVDDVNAHVNVGEFIVPKDVVSWKGEEFFQKLIAGSRKAKDTAPAKPAIDLAPVGERAAVTSGPALPVG